MKNDELESIEMRHKRMELDFIDTFIGFQNKDENEVKKRQEFCDKIFNKITKKIILQLEQKFRKSIFKRNLHHKLHKLNINKDHMAKFLLILNKEQMNLRYK